MVWHRIHEELYNPNLTIAQNIANGCDIPPEDSVPVLVLECDKPKPFVGRLHYDEEVKMLRWYESLHGYPYCDTKFTLWTPIDFPSQDEQEALYKN